MRGIYIGLTTLLLALGACSGGGKTVGTLLAALWQSPGGDGHRGDGPTRCGGIVTVQMRLEGPGRPNQR